MPCCNKTLATVIKCESACERTDCFCVPTNGKSIVCLNQDSDGNILTCTNCVCDDNNRCADGCEPFETDLKTCVCVYKNEKGMIVKCDSCKCGVDKPCYEKGKKATGCLCAEKSEAGTSAKVCNDCKCEKPCVCFETGGKSCICVCSEGDELKVCDDCNCDGNKSCGRSTCVCVDTKGKTCVCVCKDDKGNIVECTDCVCESKPTEDLKGSGLKICENCTCDGNKSCGRPSCVCIDTKDKSCVCICKDGKGGIIECKDCTCDGFDCTSKSTGDVEKTGLEVCDGCDCDRNNSCDRPNCVCFDTRGKNCVCVREDDIGNIIECNDCKC